MAALGGLQAILGRLLKRLHADAVSTGDQRNVSIQGAAKNNQIFTGDIHVSVGTSETQAGAPSTLHQLPSDVTDFAGRAAQVDKLLGVLSAPGGRVAISAIDGMGGLGKTTLAVHVAHRLTGRYADGQIVVDMAGTSAAPLSPAQGLARVIRAFEPLMLLPEAVTELRPIYLSVLRGRRVLVILDNAVDGDQMAPLVPPADCALIVTARRKIAVAGVVRVDLDLLAPAEANGLLRSIIGDGRADQAERSRIAELCGFLPLALRVAGMFLVASPHWPAAEFIAALAASGQDSACCNWRAVRRSMSPPRWR
jgi:hypothetical protein